MASQHNSARRRYPRAAAHQGGHLRPTVYRLAQQRKYAAMMERATKEPKNVGWSDDNGMTALHVLCRFRMPVDPPPMWLLHHDGVVDVSTLCPLLQAVYCILDIDPNLMTRMDCMGYTALHYACGDRRFCNCGDGNKTTLVLLLLKVCADRLDAQSQQQLMRHQIKKNCSFYTAFHMSCSRNDSFEVLQAFLRIDPMVVHFSTNDKKHYPTRGFFHSRHTAHPHVYPHDGGKNGPDQMVGACANDVAASTRMHRMATVVSAGTCHDKDVTNATSTLPVKSLWLAASAIENELYHAIKGVTPDGSERSVRMQAENEGASQVVRKKQYATLDRTHYYKLSTFRKMRLLFHALYWGSVDRFDPSLRNDCIGLDVSEPPFTEPQHADGDKLHFPILYVACRVHLPPHFISELVDQIENSHKKEAFFAGTDLTNGCNVLHQLMYFTICGATFVHSELLVNAVLTHFPRAASVPFPDRCHGALYPLHVALHDFKWRWRDTNLHLIISAFPEALQIEDPRSGLLPFQTAAAGINTPWCPGDLTTTFYLLRMKPDVLRMYEHMG